MAALNHHIYYDDPSFIPENTNQQWIDAPCSWRCPICERQKPDLIRYSKAGQTYARLVEHHCHIGDLSRDIMKQYKISFSLGDKFKGLLERFPPILVCEDCNSADTKGKKECGAHRDFSFSPSEIKLFIKINDNQNHVVDGEKAKEIYGEIQNDLNNAWNAIDVLAKQIAETNYYDINAFTHNLIERGDA